MEGSQEYVNRVILQRKMANDHRQIIANITTNNNKETKTDTEEEKPKQTEEKEEEEKEKEKEKTQPSREVIDIE